MTTQQPLVSSEQDVCNFAELASLADAVLTGRGGSAADGSAPTGLDRAAWKRLEDAGLARLTGSEPHGGAGAGWAESAALLFAVGRNAIDVPVAEHDLLAGWLLERAGREVEAGAVYSVGVAAADGVVRGVPWASQVDRLAVLVPSDGAWQVMDVATIEVEVTSVRNYAGEPRDTVALQTHSRQGTPVSPDTPGELRRRGALARGALIAGAADRALSLALEHASSREQFGRPIGKFQAIQGLIADIAAEAALIRGASDAAVRIATDSASLDQPRAAFAVAASTSCIGHATAVVVRNAHQVLGAMGYTQEHRLHRFTNRMLGWRSDFGSLRQWDRDVLQLAASNEGLWTSLVDGRDSNMPANLSGDAS